MDDRLARGRIAPRPLDVDRHQYPDISTRAGHGERRPAATTSDRCSAKRSRAGSAARPRSPGGGTTLRERRRWPASPPPSAPATCAPDRRSYLDDDAVDDLVVPRLFVAVPQHPQIAEVADLARDE